VPCAAGTDGTAADPCAVCVESAAVRYVVEVGAAGEGGSPSQLAELARVAEDSGWNAILPEDYLVHHTARDRPTWDPWVCLAAMASATSTILLGTGVTPLPRRRPW